MPRPTLRPLPLVLLAALAFVAPVSAQPAREATLEIWNRPITVLRKTVGERSPAERAAAVAERIATAPEEILRGEVTVAHFTGGHGEGMEIEVHGAPAFRLYAEDVDPESGETLEAAAAAAAERLREALRARALQSDPRRIVRGALLALGATLLFAGLVTLLMRSRRLVTARLYLASERQLERVARMGFDPRRYLLLGAKYAVDGLAWGLSGLLAYLWLTFVFVQFPYSAPWGERLGDYLGDLAAFLGRGLLLAVPDFFTVLVILGVTRALVRVVEGFFLTVSTGRARAVWIEPETAEATRRIVVAFVWVFALTAAFPFIPGSDSAAFRGIGVLAGLMLSLGSASIVSQAMSGLVVVYSRAFREGDYVKIGDVEGTVLQRGSLSTKIRNVRNEEVTLPNGVVTTAPIVNYTRLSERGGAVVSATVTIGYDAPWRQVQALLELAARRTEGLRGTPAPYVVQRALTDFYVEYQVVAHVERSPDRPLALSRLHAAIQDTFNEHGVQIMSPHFVGQPDTPVVVPRQRWNAPPATAASDIVREPERVR